MTAYLKARTNGGTQSPPFSRRFVSANFRALELPHFRTLELSHFRTSPRAFTVLELVMVVGVLSVVLAVVLPTLKTVHDAALKKRAQTEATALAQAAICYKTEYGFWPGQVVREDATSVKLNPDIPNKDDSVHLIVYGPQDLVDDITVSGVASPNVLRLHDEDSEGRAPYHAFSTVDLSGEPPYPLNPLNPKGISFLQLRNEHDLATVDFRDPWNQSYILIMGLNDKSIYQFSVKDRSANPPVIVFTQTVSNQIAFAYSIGSPADSGTNYIYSAGVRP